MGFEKDDSKSKSTFALRLMLVCSDVTVGIGFIAIRTNNADSKILFKNVILEFS